MSQGGQVGIVGAGLIGRARAMVFARADWQVQLFDTNAAILAAAPGFIRQGLDDLATHALVEDPNTTKILAQWGLPADPARLAARMAWRDQRLTALMAHRMAHKKAQLPS